MASGNVLLINNHYHIEKWNALQERISIQIRDMFGPYFSHITTRKFSSQVLLIEFSSDTSQLYFEDDHGNWLCIEGIVFALNETKRYQAEELLQMYLSDRTGFANKLDGHFVIKLYDAQSKEFIVLTDIIKNKTNFLCDTSKAIMITPFAVLTGSIKIPELDLYAFNEFMWRYYVLSERSMLKGVNKLMPATEYRIREGIISQKIYWDTPKQYTEDPFPEAVRKSINSLQETARLIHNSFDSVCIDFTMGQDTRQIIASFTSQELDFNSSLFGIDTFYEVIKVRKMASRHGIPFYQIKLQKDYDECLFDHFGKATLLGSCEEPGHLLGRILYMRSQQSKHGQVLLNGMDGHFYKNGLWDEAYTMNFYRAPKTFNIDLFLRLRAMSKNYSDHFFSDEFLAVKKSTTDYFRNLVQFSIQDCLDAPVSMQVDRFDLYHWLNFGMTANGTVNLITNSVSPLLLRRNLEYALKIPVKWKFNLSRWQRHTTFEMDAELSREKSDFGGVNMVPKTGLKIIPFLFRYYFFQTKRLRNKLLSILGFNVQTHLQEAWDYRPLFRKLYEEDEFQALMSKQDLKLDSILNKEAWREYLVKFKEGEKTLDDYEQLFKLISVELFLEKAGDFATRN